VKQRTISLYRQASTQYRSRHRLLWRVDSVKQDVRFTDNHLGRSAEVIAAG
jgi:hypothetical protein